MSRIRSQTGLASAAIILVIILAVFAVALGRSLFDKGTLLDQRNATEANMKRVADALTVYASLNLRLPCPASGTADTGLEDDSAGTVNCNSADGVVPWATLALSRADSVDGWGKKISYRVLSGTNGLTQTGGASMVACNSSLGAHIGALAAGNLCNPPVGAPPSGSPPPNTPDQFLRARSNPGISPPDLGLLLKVQEYGTERKGVAFALISHGESGYGAFVAEGASIRAQTPSSTKELANVGALGEYWIEVQSASGVALDSADHFDDVVSYMSFPDLVLRARLGARSWSQYPLSATFTSDSVAAAVAAAGGAMTGDNTNQTSLAMGGFLITGRSSSGTSNISIRTEDGVTGIGTIGGGSSAGDLNSSFGERLTFQLGDGSEFGKMDVALNAMEITDYWPLEKERAEISFWREGNPVQTATVEAWVPYFDSAPSRCLFRLASGGIFDRMDIAPVSQTGGGGSTRFTVAGIKACADATSPCVTEVPGAVACPIPAPSAIASAPTSVGTTTATLKGTVEDNGVAKGTGSGYRTTWAGYSFGEQSISLFSGSGTILAGNCLTIAGDANTYVVASGISAPGTIVLAPPGLRQSIPGGTTRAVSLVHCQTSVAFNYGLTCAVPSSAAATPGTINAGSDSTDVSASISGLACGTSYYFRTRATGNSSTTTSNYRMFRTEACASPVPGAETSAASGVTTTTATLRGFVDDNGAATTVTFEYGPTSCYGSSVAASPGSIAAGAGNTAVYAEIGNPSHPSTPTPELACNTWYHYRAVAVSTAGTTKGDDMAFRTAACP